MSDLETIIRKNQAEWNDHVVLMDHYTIPWLNLDMDILKKFVNCELSGFHEPAGRIDDPMFRKIRRLIYSDLAGKKVLCLASGGGQQSAVFSLLGAEVTVVDISQGQLQGDIKAAGHYGYRINTILGSMTDLSMLEEGSFDIVYQPISICFVPDVRPVYREVYRVLKKNGCYVLSHINPSTYPACFENSADGWDGTGYRIASPYIGGAIRMDENGNENMTDGDPTGEFRHLFIDMFCQLTEHGFTIKYIWEDARNLAKDEASGVGGYGGSHNPSYSVVQQYIDILSVK